MMFNEQAIILREICNGIMFIGAVVMIGIFAHYIWRRSRERDRWYRDIAVQAAGAISVLLLGHSIRAGASWMEFLWLDIGWDNSFWTAAIDIFLAATILTVMGKMLMVFAFSPYRWRWHLTLGTAVVAIALPIAVALIVWAQ
jgi:hypothetical protein